jgi:hypothetical protein
MVTIIALLSFNVIKIKSDNKKNRLKSTYPPEQSNNNYIEPTQFKTGFIENTPQKSANLNSKELKMDINPIYVDYGLTEIPNNCSCLEFIQAP